MSDLEETVTKFHCMLVCSIAEGSELKIAYHFNKPPTARDLARLETSINRLVRGVLRHDFMLKPRQLPKLFLDLQNGTWKDDGDNSVTITLDFGKLLPGERPPEVLEAARKMMERYEEPPENGTTA